MPVNPPPSLCCCTAVINCTQRKKESFGAGFGELVNLDASKALHWGKKYEGLQRKMTSIMSWLTFLQGPCVCHQSCSFIWADNPTAGKCLSAIMIENLPMCLLYFDLIQKNPHHSYILVQHRTFNWYMCLGRYSFI